MVSLRKILTPNQDLLLNLLSEEKSITDNFYLSGGTALAVYYLNHRYSEDLDFFSYNEFEAIQIQAILEKIKAKGKIKLFDFQKSLNRNLFFIHFSKEIIKTEFTYYPFKQIEEPKVINNFKIDSLLDIAVNKFFTIYQSPRSRDFIDLYFILEKQNWTLSYLKKYARIKFDTFIDPLQLSQQIFLVKKLKDYPRMIINIKPENWQNFWLSEMNNLKKEVLV